MKAQTMFGGTKPKATGVKTRQVGQTGSQKVGKITVPRPVKARQVGVTGSASRSTGNHQMLRHGSTAEGTSITRPLGKENNYGGN